MQFKILKRSRIERKLSDIYCFPLTIVEAPAGYGKTTAVKDFFTERAEKPLWISLKKIQEYSDYWIEFTLGLSKMCSYMDKRLQNMEYPSNAPQRSKVLSILNSMDFGKPAVVIFDNYELLKDQQLNHLLLQIAEDEIENLHIVIITRDTTEIDFVPLLSRGKCCVISQHQIKFTAEEISDYCTMTKLPISAEEIEKIADYTDGWISMIYILLLGVEENIPIGFNSTLDELIDKALFSVYERDTRVFLLKLSFMGSFTINQAEFVTGRKDVAVLIKSLKKKNAFISYDSQDKKYKIHPVLLDFLKSKQDFSKAEQKELYSRLGQWHLQHNELYEAYAYLALAEEGEKILAHLNNVAPIRNLYTDFDGADKLFSAVSKKLLFETPIAYLRYLFYSVVAQKKEVISDLTERLDELETYYLNKKDIDENKRNYVIGEIMCVRKFTAFNNLEKMHTYNNKIISLLNGQQSSIMLRVNEFTFGSPHYLYIYFRDAGSLKAVTSICEQNIHVSFSDGCGMGSDSLAAAEYACETGNFHDAMLESQKAVYKAETKAQWSVIFCAEFNMIRAALALGKISTALEILRQLSSYAEKLNIAVYNSTEQLCIGYVYSSLGMPEKIPLWLQNGDMSSLNMFFGGMGFDKLVYAKTLLAKGEYLKLEALSDSFNSSFAIFQNRLGFLHNAILLAAVKYHLYGTGAAVPALIEALKMAEPDGIVLPFAECTAHLMPIFKKLPAENRNAAFTSRVFSVCTNYAEGLKNILPEKPELTAREEEILRLLADGLTRNKIAERLTISPATAKTHLQSIYKKLSADGKASAVEIARLNGFL